MKKEDSKIRVNITVDKVLLDKAKTNLYLFGGKVSTLFNAYLSDFVGSLKKEPYEEHKELLQKIKDMELRIKKLEEK